MMRQLKTEGFALWKRKGILLVTLSAFLLSALFVCSSAKMSMDAPSLIVYSFGNVDFLTVGSLCAAWFLGAQFHDKTLQNEIKLGYSRGSILITRYLFSCLIAIAIHIAWSTGSILGYLLKYETDFSLLNPQHYFWIALILFKIAAIQSITFFTVCCIRKTLPAILASALFTFFFCNFMKFFSQSKIFTYSCFSFAEYREQQAMGVSLIYTFTFGFFVLGFTYLLFCRADID